MVKFHKIEVPIAISMLELGQKATHPFQRYFCYWSAFNNIYTLIGQKSSGSNLVARPRLDKNTGAQKNQERWGFIFPSVILPSERELISEAINQLETKTKNTLITHENIDFFVNRIPKGAPGSNDAAGQLINGVLNITRTISPDMPVWSPINKQKYEKYLKENLSDQNELAEQIIFMLYTIRNNLVHGSKDQNEANDVEVVEMALPLLEVVVGSFIST